MSDVSAQCAKANRLALSCDDTLRRIELADSNAQGGGVQYHALFKRQFEDLDHAVSELDATVRMRSMNPSGNASGARTGAKLNALLSKRSDLRTCMERMSIKQQRRRDADRDRAELFSRSADVGASDSGAYPSMDQESAMRKSVLSAKQALEEAYDTGVGVLGSMSGTQERLKGIHRKMLDVTQKLNLGGSLLKAAGKRQSTDAWIGCGMIVAMTGLVVLLLYWKFS